MDLFADDTPQPKGLLQGLKIDESFAKAYEARKRGAELKKLKAELGDDAGSADEEETDYSSEDSDAELATPAVDAAIFRTLSKIRKRDAAIYDSTRNVFAEEERAAPAAASSSKRTKTEKPTRLKDFQRKQLLAGGADEDADRRSAIRTPAQESEELRKEVTDAFKTAVDSDSEEDEEMLLVPRLKTADETAAEDDEYRQFLKAQGADVSADEADEGEAFLRDYILNRAWLDKGKARAHPTHHEVLETIDDDEDAAFEEHAEQFEHAYNFRFEDPVQGDAGQVVGHSRKSAASVRKTDDSRKVARENKKRLKELKTAEALAKLQELSKMTGGDVKGLEGYDLDADFDPDEHDRQMQGAFDQDWYAEPETGVDEDGKPVWADDVDITDIVGEEPEERFDDESIDEVEPTDEVYDPSAPEVKKKKRKRTEEVAEASTSTGNKRKRSKLDELLDEDVPYAQIIGGGLASRFHYETVAPMTYGLTPAEILMATDAELNSIASLKRLATFRNSDSGKRNRRALQELRDRIKQRQWGDDSAGYEDQKPLKKPKASSFKTEAAPTHDGAPKPRMGKKRRQKMAKRAEREANEASEV